MSDMRLIGKDIIRNDVLAKVMGCYEYGMDFNIEGALESLVVRSTIPHARIINIETCEASALQGVRAIITGSETKGIYMLAPVEDQPPIAADTVRYFGEPIALIAADTLDIAIEAKKLLKIEYEPLPVIEDPEAAMRPDALLLHPNWEHYNTAYDIHRDRNICSHAKIQKGDVERGFAEADVIVENDFTTSSVHQAHVEPRAAAAVVHPDGSITVYSNTQLLYAVRDQVARVTGLPVEKINVVPLGVGGGFGSKLYAQIEPFVALLARKTGRAVHMYTPLEEELMAGRPRCPFKIHIKTGVRKDGTIVAHQCRCIVDSGAYASTGPEDAGVAALMLTGTYRIENVCIDNYAVYTNKMNFGAYRGPGGPQPIFALESHIDEIAKQLSMDPLEFRLKNIVEDGDEVANGQVLCAVGLREALERAAAAIEWKKSSGPNRGKGLAISWWTTTIQPSTVRIALDSEGRVVVSIGTNEIGTGSIMGAVPQVVAETMGVEMKDVIIDVCSTNKGMYDWGTQGSRCAFNLGLASRNASLALLHNIIVCAVHILKLPEEDLFAANGFIQSKTNPEKCISFAELARSDTTLQLWIVYRSNPEPARYKKERIQDLWYPAFNYPTFCCHAVEVEVDPETGQVSILRYAAAHDVGYAINPALVKADIHGGTAQGIGMALMEEVQYSKGIRTNINWTDYKIPTTVDIPPIEAIIVEHSHPNGGPFGCKGLGETPAIPPAGALANAIAHATGARVKSLPMTAEKILKAIQEHGEKK